MNTPLCLSMFVLDVFLEVVLEVVLKGHFRCIRMR